MAAKHWTRNFTLSDDDVETVLSLLLEREVPLSTEALALELLERRLDDERARVEARYENTQVYDPAGHYEPGQKLVFPALAFATATVREVRAGDNPEYGDFSVIEVEFAEEDRPVREYATDFTPAHKLNAAGDAPVALPGITELSAAQILDANREDILVEVESRLVDTPSLAYIGQKWFPLDLMLSIDEGHLNLAEAVLDIAGGGPMTTEAILAEIGGVGAAAQELQVFSMNYALNDDARFDEVGPAGEVLWFLSRLEPADVKEVPANLRYTPISFDRAALTDEMAALEREIGDELSDLTVDEPLDVATVTLIYPHRRNGTLPLNGAMRQVFPSARRAPRIFVQLVDGQDGEIYPGWVMQHEGYIAGLNPFYRKHKIPIGGFVSARRGEQPGQFVINFDAYRPRSEYVALMSIRNDQVYFENIKRQIGADYDDLMVIGVDDLNALEQFAQQTAQSRKTLAGLLKLLIPALGNLTPQATVHAKTVYSALNALRRCPPGPLLATLNANPDFENVGGHYWRLSGD